MNEQIASVAVTEMLPVAVEKHHNVEPLGHEVPVPSHLVAAIAEVLGMFQNLQLGETAECLQAHRQLKRVVLACIIEDRDFFSVMPNIRRYALEHFRKCVYGIVGDDENADALAVVVRHS